MLTIFVFGVLVGLLIGAFVWTALAVARSERDLEVEVEKRIRIAKRAWERDEIERSVRRLYDARRRAPTHPVFDRQYEGSA